MTERLRLFARKDIGDAVRGRQIHMIAAAFVLVGLLVGYLAGGANSGSSSAIAAATTATFLFLAPAAAVAVSHDSIVGKRLDGELTVLLGLPYTRREVIFGTLLGRLSVVGSVTLLGVFVTVATATVRGARPVPGALLLCVFGVVVVTSVFASVAVAISAVSPSPTTSSTGAFGVFVLFIFRIWGSLPGLVDTLLRRLLGAALPGWVDRVVANVTPYAAARNAIGPFAAPVRSGFSTYTSPLASGVKPLVQHPAVGAVLVALWVAAPIAFAYRSFARTDL